VGLHVERTAASVVRGSACQQDCCRCRAWVCMSTGLLPVACVGLHDDSVWVCVLTGLLPVACMGLHVDKTAAGGAGGSAY